MKIGILGTRGIPNHYGGFEQFAEYLSVGLVERGHEVFCYCSKSHPYQQTTFNGVQLIHCWDPEDKIGTAGQFFYDLSCFIDARKRGFDILLQLGYTSSSIWSHFYPSDAVVVTNMDGLEWKRSKYSAKVQRFLKWAEKRAVRTSDFLVSDSIGIQNYLLNEYQAQSTYIPYGAEVFRTPDQEAIVSLGVEPEGYDMLIARMEPENNIEIILDGVAMANSQVPFLVVGNAGNRFGQYLQNKFRAVPQIRFLGAIYHMELLNNLRYYSRIYFHGHSVGGTNPSLLEAMASAKLLAAHKNEFNSSILGEEAVYFESAQDVSQILSQSFDLPLIGEFRSRNGVKVDTLYTWPRIIDQYEQLFFKVSKTK
jgi:glycosyltransferase involved in cell wall biosynthesis